MSNIEIIKKTQPHSLTPILHNVPVGDFCMIDGLLVLKLSDNNCIFNITDGIYYDDFSDEHEIEFIRTKIEVERY